MILSRTPRFLYISFFRNVAQNELDAADNEKTIGVVILSFISLITVVFYFFVKNAHATIRVFAEEVMDKVKELDEEKLKTEKALHEFLPVSVVRNMKTQTGNETTTMMAESFECVTILYGEIVGFDKLTCDSNPNEVPKFLGRIALITGAGLHQPFLRQPGLPHQHVQGGWRGLQLLATAGLHHADNDGGLHGRLGNAPQDRSELTWTFWSP